MASRTRQRRTQLDKPGIAERTGAAEATVDYWYLQRATTGFPPKADTDTNGRDWWWQNDIDTFHTAHLAARAATFTTIDRSGDPDELLTAPQAARVLGYADRRGITPTLRNHPDYTELLPSGALRRYWHRRTLWEFADSRVQRHSTGRPAGTTNHHRQPHPYADDPRLHTARQLLDQAEAAGQSTTSLGAQLARQLGISARAGQRLINTARHARDATAP
jgi:hypothetical protein